VIALRRILFAVFAVAYLTLCPYFILRVLTILRTGLIAVHSDPAEAGVLINERPVSGTTPLTIPRLSPGEYVLRVYLPGFRTWTQTVKVTEGEATALDRILLLPEALKVKELTEAGFDRLITIDQMPFFLLETGCTADAWRVFYMENGSLHPLLPAGSPFSAARIENVFTVPQSAQILLRAALGRKSLVLRADLSTEPHRIEDISTHFPEPPTRILWDASAEDVIFSLQDGKVRKIDLRIGRDDPNFGTDWRGIGVFEERVFGMDSETRIRSTAFDKTSAETIFDDPKSGREIFGESGGFAIMPLDTKTILFLSDDGRLCQSGLPNVLVEKGVRGVRLDNQLARALVWTADRLGMLEASPAKSAGNETEHFQKGRQVTWTFEGAEDITDAWFVNGGSQALVLDGSRVYLLDLFPGVHARPREVIEGKAGGGIRLDKQRRVAYALDPNRSRLLSIQLAPRASALAEETSP
jgi:hypothetical protein